MNIVLLRESESLAKDKKRLSSVKVHSIPVLKSVRIKAKIPRGDYDVVVLSSQKTVHYLNRLPSTSEVLCIGQFTAKAFKKKFKKRLIVLSESNSKGLIQYFRQRKKLRIFFPRSALGDPKTVRELRALGHRVCVRKIYTLRRFDVRSPLQKLIRAQDRLGWFVTSPSIFKALRSMFSDKQLRQFPGVWLSIGPTTTKELQKVVRNNFLEASETSLEAMLKVYKHWHRTCF